MLRMVTTLGISLLASVSRSISSRVSRSSSQQNSEQSKTCLTKMMKNNLLLAEVSYKSRIALLRADWVRSELLTSPLDETMADWSDCWRKEERRSLSKTSRKFTRLRIRSTRGSEITMRDWRHQTMLSSSLKKRKEWKFQWETMTSDNSIYWALQWFSVSLTLPLISYGRTVKGKTCSGSTLRRPAPYLHF